MYNLTWNERKRQTNDMRKMARSRLRKGLTKEYPTNNPDLYLLYTDVDQKEPRMCYSSELLSFCIFELLNAVP